MVYTTNNMKKGSYKYISTLLIFVSLFFQAGYVVFAQEASSGAEAEQATVSDAPEKIPSETPLVIDTTSVPVVVDDSTVIPDEGQLQPSVTVPVVQDTYNTQDEPTVDPTEVPEDTVVDSPIIEQETTTPSDGSGITTDDSETTTDTTTLTENTETENTTDTATDATTSSAEDTIPPEDAAIDEVIVPEQQVVVVKPKPIYAFSLTNRTIQTHKKIKNPQKTEQPQKKSFDKKGKEIPAEVIPDTIDSVVDNEVVPTLDNENGALTVQGECTNVYYTVLVYKHESDYEDNSNSFIFNRAFPCVGGSYRYTISDLPQNLSNGTYYLLIGDQGETGTWTPATKLTEITLNRN